MKLLFTGLEDPAEIHAWSGIPYYLTRALRRRGFEVATMGGLRDLRMAPFHLLGRVYGKLGHGDYRLRSEPAVLRIFASKLQAAIRREKPDALLSISYEPLAYLDTEIPSYIVHDATFRLLAQTYGSFVDLSAYSKQTGEAACQLGLSHCTMSLPASGWARQSVCDDYGVPAAKVQVMPMGANLAVPPTREEAEQAIAERLGSEEISFLFAGVDWQRKGGDVAVRIVGQLVARGIKARLHIAGCTPPAEVLRQPYVQHHGFLSKNVPEQEARLRALFRGAGFFILPSVAEAYGCVFCEANSFGVPSIARATGGITEIVREGRNGYLLSDQLPEEKMVELLLGLCRDRDRYRELARSSRREYEERLNWDTYVERFRALAEGRSR